MRVSINRFHILNMDDSPYTAEMFREWHDIAEVDCVAPDEAELLRIIPRYDAYLCSLKVRVTRDVIDRAQRLKVIATPSTGTDHIDTEYAASRGIAVISLKHEADFLDQLTATAELSWGLLLGVVRKIPWAFAEAKQGKWARDAFRGMQLSGKTLGVLGCGRLGRMVARYGNAFRMRVIAYDVKPVREEDVEQVDWETFLAQSDIISIHIHLTPGNVRLLDKKAFGQMKQGVVVINTSRGAVIDEEALLEALRAGKVAAAGLDVIDGEWNDDLERHPLIRYAQSHDHVLISPHIGGITRESNRLAYQYTLDMLRNGLTTRTPTGDFG